MTIPLPQPGPKYDANNEAQTRSAITRFFSKVFNRDSDKDLAALEDLDGTGMLARTAAEMFALRTLTAGTGIGVANGNGVSGNPTISITDAELLAIAGLTSAANKLIRFTGSGTADLVDFESGTWTPVLTFGTPGDLSVSYAVQLGAYFRVGRLVVVWAYIQTSTFTHSTASGALTITGAPFAASQFGMTVNNGMAFSGITFGSPYTQVSPRIDHGSSSILFTASGSGLAFATVTSGSLPSGGTVILRPTLLYLTA